MYPMFASAELVRTQFKDNRQKRMDIPVLMKFSVKQVGNISKRRDAGIDGKRFS